MTLSAITGFPFSHPHFFWLSRLKIKCDKQIPCQSCQVCPRFYRSRFLSAHSHLPQRRGCTALCPNGERLVSVSGWSTTSISIRKSIYWSGNSVRVIFPSKPSSPHVFPSFVLAATEHLHRKISTLGDRVRQLEDALSTLQAQHSSEPHPLLADGLVSPEERPGEDEDTKMRDETGGGESSKKGGVGQASSSGSNAGEVIDAFGTLSIAQHGVARFFGPTGGSEVRVTISTPFPADLAAPSLESVVIKPRFRKPRPHSLFFAFLFASTRRGKLCQRQQSRIYPRLS